MNEAIEKTPVQFRVLKASSEDPENPASELLVTTPQGKGWQTAKFPNYPQSLFFLFPSPHKLSSLQLLSHQYKISSKVEIFVALPQETGSVILEDLPMRKLGYFYLSTNDQGQFQSRELKTVFLDAPALYLKLVFHKPHVNSLNVFSQVGVIGVSFFGSPVHGALQAVDKPSRVNDLALRSVLDEKTIRQLEVLERQKAEAIAAEEYIIAKDINAKIQNLKAIGVSLAKLEQRKEAALMNEDYDSAEVIKQEIRKLKVEAGLSGPPPRTVSQPYISPPDHRFHEDPEATPDRGNLRIDSTVPRSGRPRRGQASKEKGVDDSELRDFDEPPQAPQAPQPPQPPRVPQPSQAFYEDDRPLPTTVNSKTPGSGMKEYPDEYPDTYQEEPEKAKVRDKKTWAKVQEFTSEFAEAFLEDCVTSKWTDRESAATSLLEVAQQWNAKRVPGHKIVTGDDPERLFQSILKLGTIFVSDGIAAINSLGLATLESLASKAKAVESRAVGETLQKNIVPLLERAADGRTQEISEILKAFSKSTGLLPSDMISWLLRGNFPKTFQSQKALIARLSILQALVAEAGPRLRNAAQSTLGFAVQQLNNQSKPVRDAGHVLILEVFKVVGEETTVGFLEEAKIRKNHLESLMKDFAKLQPGNQSGHGGTASAELSQHEDELDQTGTSTTCNFCKTFDPSFASNDQFDLHLWKNCPMLVSCKECHQVVEIAELAQHLLEQCLRKNLFAECMKCQLPVLAQEMSKHTKSPQCRPPKSSDPSEYVRCPLCFVDLAVRNADPDTVWRNHLVVKKCPKNERTNDL